MKINILSKNYEVREALKEVIEKKVNKLSKYFDDDTVVKVTLKKQNNNYRMEITVDYKGNFMRADVIGENFFDNIDILLPKIEKQIYRYRGKLENKLKDGAFKEALIYSITADELKESKIVKTKQFRLAPMSIDEAISELELIGHTFYVFKELKSGEVKVIYRRDDGNIGYIDPVL